MSTGLAVGLVALLVLGGGAVAYAVTREKAPKDPLAPADPSVATLPPGAIVGARDAQEFGWRGFNEGPRNRAMRDRDPYGADIRPPRILPDNPKTLTPTSVASRTRSAVTGAGALISGIIASGGGGSGGSTSPVPPRPPTFGWV